MWVRFFIARPIFAWVIAIAIMLAGLASLTVLPLAQYPDVTPATIVVSANYPGASAETVESTVTQLLEQQLTGIDGLLYFSSSSSSSGSTDIELTFHEGTNPDIAQVQVQNKVQLAVTRLPSEVQQLGVSVTKSQSAFLMIVDLYDESNTASGGDLSDYLVSNFQDPIARLPGVGGVQVFGSQYAMRIWLDPAKLASYNLMPMDISAAIQAQNIQISAGEIGGLPSPATQQLNATVTAQSKLKTAQEFREVIVKREATGATVRLADVARIELGLDSYTDINQWNGQPAAGLAVKLAPGANALATADGVHAMVAQLARGLPPHYKTVYTIDSTPFIRASIEEVLKTLLQAIGLVVVVMFVFLQSWRATLIPAVAVPVVLLGTLGVLQWLGYSINTLTMFAIVLSIGLLVDDAIVVVENVERIMREQGLAPREATLRSMQEITSALIGIATVLSAVFLPMAFLSGSTGVIYRQFSVTIVTSMALSVVVALTLTPSLCVLLLKAPHSAHGGSGVAARLNMALSRCTNRYDGVVTRSLTRPLRWILAYGVIIAALAVLFWRLPTSFLPNEDQGEVMVQYTLPQGASISRTMEIGRQVQRYFADHERANIKGVFSVAGFSFNGNGQNAGVAFVPLKDWSLRKGFDNQADQIAQRATRALASIRDAQVFSLSPSPVPGLGEAGGFEFQLLASAGTDRATLRGWRDTLLANAKKDPKLTAVRLGDLGESPQLQVDIDHAKASALGLSLADVNSTLSAAWAGTYVNDFIDRGRVKRVYMQADAPFRSSPEDLNRWYVRGDSGTMTPFSAFATTRWVYGSETLTRYNGLASYSIQGAAASGVSSGTAMDEMQQLARRLPSGNQYAWSGLSFQERLASGQTAKLFTVSILVVFLCLAALYESWSVPFSVLLVTPLGVIGAVVAATWRGLDNDIYFQVALLTTIGLAAKNAILIVEFAETAYRNGAELISAARDAARLRLRPIIMTSLAFMAGVLPLALSTGAGANGRISIGSGVVGGTLTATALTILLVPLFFVLVRSTFRVHPRHSAPAA